MPVRTAQRPHLAPSIDSDETAMTLTSPRRADRPCFPPSRLPQEGVH